MPKKLSSRNVGASFFPRCKAILYAYQFISLNSKIVMILNPIFFILSYLIIFDRGRQKRGLELLSVRLIYFESVFIPHEKNFILYSKKRNAWWNNKTKRKTARNHWISNHALVQSITIYLCNYHQDNKYMFSWFIFNKFACYVNNTPNYCLWNTINMIWIVLF